jgi:hypothetical protein
MSKKLHAFIWFIFLVAFGLMVYVFYLISYPIKTIDVLNQPMPVTPNEIVRGSSDFTVEIHYIKYIDADIHTARHIECKDGNLVTMTPDERSFPVGEHIITTNHTKIPDKTSLDECKLVYTVTYQFNPLRSVTQVFETEYFQVIE